MNKDKRLILLLSLCIILLFFFIILPKHTANQKLTTEIKQLRKEIASLAEVRETQKKKNISKNLFQSERAFAGLVSRTARKYNIRLNNETHKGNNPYTYSAVAQGRPQALLSFYYTLLTRDKLLDFRHYEILPGKKSVMQFTLIYMVNK